MSNRLSELIRLLETRGISTSRELQEALGVSQATISRLVTSAGSQVVRIGRGPKARYARPHDLFSNLALFRLDRQGVPVHLADIQPLRGGEFYVVAHQDECWLTGLVGDGFFPGLPYFLDDLRPQGFIGRAIARSLGGPYPDDPRRWNSGQILTWLAEHGRDLTGDLVLGKRALEHARSRQATPAQVDLARLADESMAGVAPGSSAGGEQPKFLLATGSSHALVKFSGRGDGAEASRWRDILIAEHHALMTLAAHGIPAAESTLVDADGRTFLIVLRFDRAGELGRLPMLSLAAVDVEFSGTASDWTATMRQLAKLGQVTAADADRAAWLQLFGHWIGNTDMHLGNLSLGPEAQGFSLLPVYDMTAMRWAPVRGELPPQDAIKPPVRDPRLAKSWSESAHVALEYWRHLQVEPRLSTEFRSIAVDCAATIEPFIG